MRTTTTTTPLIVETSRGPCIAGRRLTVYVIYEHLQSGLEKEFIKKHLCLSDAQLDAAIAYIARYKDKIEKDYAEIVRQSEERQAHYEQIYRERSRFPADLSLEERAVRLRQILNKKTTIVSLNDEQNPA